MRLPNSHQTDRPNQYIAQDNDNFISSESDRQLLLIKQQDEELDELSASVERIGGVGLTIHEELLAQEKIIDELGLEMDNTSNRLDFIQKKVAMVMKKAGAKGQIVMILFLVGSDMGNWSQLPYELILIIVNRLNTMEDFLAFSGVCSSWRSVYLNKDWTPGPLLPWLMLSEKTNSRNRVFFSICTKKVFELYLPEASGKRCWGSSHGWLVTIGLDLKIHLLNPMTRVQMDLPPQSTFQNQPEDQVHHGNLLRVRSCFIHKAILLKTSALSTGTEDDFIVAAIFGEHRDLALAKPGSRAWITVETYPPYPFRDVVCCNGQVFALTDFGTLVVVDIGDPNRPRAVSVGAAMDLLGLYRKYND
ncbi:hypothetical protein F0562_015432 [Nyssa sinensis]|uniref:t-SNARE coiled-coil homology domain-containing protein n=1 Tax=Nyssa sinensis TaxID=561372 RepID=A0A5J4ZK87_9ASTE|nr:hypothetical protein F0562_015432 [Nyssa sinensis]